MKHLFTITSIAFIIGIVTILSLKIDRGPLPLSNSEMDMIYGGDCCGPAEAAAFRQDECYHAEESSGPCAADACIANYILDADCPAFGGTNCTATIAPDQICAIQYHRLSSGCAANYLGEVRPLYVHHFGHDCAPRDYKFRCDTTGCDGTLVETYIRYGLIIR